MSKHYTWTEEIHLVSAKRFKKKSPWNALWIEDIFLVSAEAFYKAQRTHLDRRHFCQALIHSKNNRREGKTYIQLALNRSKKTQIMHVGRRHISVKRWTIIKTSKNTPGLKIYFCQSLNNSITPKEDTWTVDIIRTIADHSKMRNVCTILSGETNTVVNKFRLVFPLDHKRCTTIHLERQLSHQYMTMRLSVIE